jgi:carboxymethylenebutenolidase
LNPHIEDVARRLAVENFIAVAPDLLTSQGGYPGDEDKAREAFAKIDRAKAVEDWIAAANHARTISGGNGKLGALGFCYGGGVANMIATRVPELVACATFYGVAPPPDKVAAIKAEMLFAFAENDGFVNPTWPAYEAALKAVGVKFEAHFYPGTQHAFHNDTTPRYDEKSAQQAWARMLTLFNRTLRG